MIRTLDRRLFLRGTAAAAGATLLTACGGTTAPPTATTRTVPTAYGPSTCRWRRSGSRTTPVARSGHR